MRNLFALLLLTISPSLNGQTWAPYVSVEEVIHLTDVRPSLNYSNLSIPASNAGMRLGGMLSIDEKYSAELTIGVVNLGTPGIFKHSIIPIELIGHYNLLNGREFGALEKFNVDVGVGSGLAEFKPGLFAFSEHLALGASMQLPVNSSRTEILVGFRYNYFRDDFLDGLESGIINDGMLRLFTAFHFNGPSKKIQNEITKKRIDLLNTMAQLEKVKNSNIELQKKIQEEENKRLVEIQALTEKLNTLNNKSFDDQASLGSTEKHQERGVAIVIGSFENLDLAEAFQREVGGGCFIAEEKELNRYRVIFGIFDDFKTALQMSEKINDQYKHHWLVKY